MRCPSIYKIVNRKSGKYYVGSSINAPRRWKEHQYYLNKNTHHNDYLQRAWNKYGSPEFDFVLVEKFPDTMSDQELLNEEQKWLNIAETDHKTGRSYNLTFVAFSPNVILSDYSKQKRSESLKKVVKTEEWKRNISQSHSGIRPSIETKKKQRISHLGKTQTKYHKQNATESRRKNWEFISPEGTIIQIRDLKSFCRHHNLHAGNMYSVAKGLRTQHKGWKNTNL